MKQISPAGELAFSIGTCSVLLQPPAPWPAGTGCSLPAAPVARQTHWLLVWNLTDVKHPHSVINTSWEVRVCVLLLLCMPSQGNSWIQCCMNCAVRLGSSQRSKGLGSHIPNCIFLFLGPCEVSSLISCLPYNTLCMFRGGGRAGTAQQFDFEALQQKRCDILP